MERFWLLRNDHFDEELVDEGFVSVGWAGTPDLRDLERQSISERLDQLYPDARPRTISAWASTLDRFAHEVKVGDYVVAPSGSRPILRIGEIKGDYYFDSHATDHQHRRPVRWMQVDIPRRQLPPGVRNAIRSIGTLSEIHQEVPYFEKLAQGHIGFVTDPHPVPDPSAGRTWVVGATINGEDRTADFIEAGTWSLHNGLTGAAADMRSGDRIAIKASFTQSNGLPFENHGIPVSVMRIKARGLIRETRAEHAVVDWDRDFAPRDWYFYTHQSSVWKLRTDRRYARELEHFIFDDEAQDIDLFLSDPYYARYSLPQPPAPEPEVEPTGSFRLSAPSAQPVYAAADRWKRALTEGTSLFTDAPLDYTEAVRGLVRGFIEQPDIGPGTFLGKLASQVADQPTSSVQLAAELLFIYFLPVHTSSIKSRTKRTAVDEISSWRQDAVSVPDALQSALESGIARVGTGYHTYRWVMFRYLIRFVEAISALPETQRRGALNDWRTFQTVLGTIDDTTAWSLRFLLEHMFFPHHALASSSRDDREQIAKSFDVADDDTGENALSSLEPNVRYGDRYEINLYRYPYRYLWRDLNAAQEAWGSWAFLCAETPGFISSQDVAHLSWTAKLFDQSKSDETLPDLLARTFEETGQSSPLLTDWVDSHPDEARAVFAEARTDGPARWIDRLEQAIEPPAAKKDQFLEEVSLVLSGLNPELPVRFESSTRAVDALIGHTSPAESATLGEIYNLYCQQVDVMRAAIQHTGGSDLDRGTTALLAHRLIELDPVETDWSAETRTRFVDWRSGRMIVHPPNNDYESPTENADDQNRPPGPPSSPPDRPRTLTELAEALHIASEAGHAWLELTRDLLQSKRQMILQGPPGTGKTYMAQEIAEFLTGSAERVTLVQFHPGTSYEDFVQGLRPIPDEPTSFALTDGPLLRLAKRAASDPAHSYALVIDEFNRANIPAVFGELYFLLEYRNRSVTMTYGDSFSIPENLFFIGTMNTADRSITLVDSALRRRFAIRDLRPGEPPMDEVLISWTEQHAPDLKWLPELLDLANSRIADPDQAIGPSHFLHSNLSEESARQAWEFTVMPTLKEHFYGEPDRLAPLTFDALKAVVTDTESDAEAD
ncbi:AAA family ATPase [Brevibacterium ihuae]|uniref:AAA family ATPase n=1 Tax=Brevibacterium ihuae TaxID=1631743 RepID=UPI000C75E2E5|nr:AAA family ATPase [Brevibacterium ihuae]